MEGIEAKVTKVVLNGYNKATKYVEFECEFVKTDDGNYLVTLDEAGYELFTTNNYYEAMGNYAMVDVYYDCTVLEVPSEQYDSVDIFLADVIVPAE
jgi:GH15 family glucan-1,4-alpha-glucosidase